MWEKVFQHQLPTGSIIFLFPIIYMFPALRNISENETNNKKITMRSFVVSRGTQVNRVGRSHAQQEQYLEMIFRNGPKYDY